MALQHLLQACADVAGPVPTSADAQHLACEQRPDAALLDFNLRGGELADVLLDRLHEHGIYVIVTTGYSAFSVTPCPATTCFEPWTRNGAAIALRLNNIGQ